MLGVRFSLFTKIILWFFLNLLVIGAGLVFIFNFRFDPNSPYFGRTSNRIEAVTRLIESETNERSRAERDDVLQKYSGEYKADFFLFDNQGRQLGGKETTLPAEVVKEITRAEGGPPPAGRPAGEPPEARPGPLQPGPPPSVYITTKDPTRYWFIGRTMTIDPETGGSIRSRVIAASDSFTGNGLFFDVKPFIVLAAGIFGFSIIFWFPFVRNITGAVGQMTNATKRIADEDFEVRVSEKSTDELGVLGKSINHLAARLSGFVHGQKRFLGDISHELNSPLARMQFALGILEERVGESEQAYVQDVKEEVELMSKLVSELLTYAEAGIRTPEMELEKVRLRPLVDEAVRRETANENARIEILVAEDAEALARPELLSRALSNVIRNAIRHSGESGEINISTENGNGTVRISVTDNGPGVPESEIGRIFDPLYRVESDRSRQTGGSGLGLAIVKACIEACQGKVVAENREPSGLKMTFILKN
jgi:two-component system sensor histidine kinase CpxA